MVEEKSDTVSVESDLEAKRKEETEGGVEVSEKGLEKLTQQVEDNIEVHQSEVEKEGEELLTQLEDSRECKREIEEGRFWDRAKTITAKAKKKLLVVFKKQKVDIEARRNEEEIREDEQSLDLAILSGDIRKANKIISESRKRGSDLEIDKGVIIRAIIEIYAKDFFEDEGKPGKLFRFAKKQGIEIDKDEVLEEGINRAVELGKMHGGVFAEAKKRGVDKIRPESVQRGLEHLILIDLRNYGKIDKKSSTSHFIDDARKRGIEPNVSSAVNNLRRTLREKIENKQSRLPGEEAWKLKAYLEDLDRFSEEIGVLEPLR